MDNVSKLSNQTRHKLPPRPVSPHPRPLSISSDELKKKGWGSGFNKNTLFVVRIICANSFPLDETRKLRGCGKEIQIVEKNFTIDRRIVNVVWRAYIL